MRYYMFNKPRGYITACSDPRHPTVMDLIPKEERDGLFPVGRLDKDTEGFLILTDDGKFCFRVNDPTCHIEKTYFFWARGDVDDEKIKELEKGVWIFNGKDHFTMPAKVQKLKTATLRDIADLVDEDSAKLKFTGRGDIKVTSFTVTICEGKKHQVKKMAKAVGMYIVYLERIAIADVALDPDLPRGSYRPLSEEELIAIGGKHDFEVKN